MTQKLMMNGGEIIANTATAGTAVNLAGGFDHPDGEGFSFSPWDHFMLKKLKMEDLGENIWIIARLFISLPLIDYQFSLNYY